MQNAPDQIEEVIVTARRGDAEVAAEREFDEGDVAAEGADTIGELLSNLQPFIDPRGTDPVILINGKPVGFDRSILSYPPEALARVTVLKPEAGPRYGAMRDTRVVNLVLKPKFASFDAEAGVNAATAGGQAGGNVGASRSAIAEDWRWNARAQLGRQSALRKSARRIPRPAAGLGDTPTPAPGVDGSIDPDDFETLQPSIRNVTLGVNVAHPLGPFTASLSLDAMRSRTSGLRGIPRVSLALPSDAVSSGVEEGTLLRSFAGPRALRSDNRMQTMGATLALTGTLRGVQTNLGASFSRSDSSDVLETGIEVERLQSMLDAGDRYVDLGAPFAERFVRATRSRSRGDNLSLRLSLNKALPALPAGPLSWNLAANTSWLGNRVSQSDGTAAISTRLERSQSSGQLSVNVPISSRGSAFGGLGDLTADLSFGRHGSTGSTAATSYGGGMTWQPIADVMLRGSIDRSQAPPSFDQLNGPTVSTVTRVFDYATEEFAEPVWTRGGNPSLEQSSQTAYSLSMMVQALARDLTLNLTYRGFVANNNPSEFPELTPAIEAAFPERVTRGADGRLLAVDARQVSIERQTDASLSSSVTLRLGGPRRRGSHSLGPGPIADRVQFNLALNYQLRVRSESLIREGLPVIDRLADSGTSRHALDFRINGGTRALGGSVSANWSSVARVAAPDGADGAFRLSPPLMFNLSTFANLDDLVARSQSKGWARRLKISFDVQNLFNGYRRVTLPDGSVPPGYSRDEVNPLGRTIRLGLRKQF